MCAMMQKLRISSGAVAFGWMRAVSAGPGMGKAFSLRRQGGG
jgi:hypothetical protein